MNNRETVRELEGTVHEVAIVSSVGLWDLYY